jgi:hypothetical protein
VSASPGSVLAALTAAGLEDLKLGGAVVRLG